MTGSDKSLPRRSPSPSSSAGRGAATLSPAQLVEEARLQADALKRLSIWLRLALSLLALGVLGVLWGAQQNVLPLSIVGGVIAVVTGFVTLVLKVGIKNGRKNVEALLRAAEEGTAGSEEQPC